MNSIPYLMLAVVMPQDFYSVGPSEVDWTGLIYVSIGAGLILISFITFILMNKDELKQRIKDLLNR